MIIEGGDKLYNYLYWNCEGANEILSINIRKWFENNNIAASVCTNDVNLRVIEISEEDYIFLSMKYL